MSNPTHPTTDLAAALLAEIARVEAVAREATPGPWTVGASSITDWNEVEWEVGQFVVTVERGEEGFIATHVALHDPDRVLARCAADREIVDRCSHIPPGVPCWALAQGVIGIVARGYGVEVEGPNG